MPSYSLCRGHSVATRKVYDINGPKCEFITSPHVIRQREASKHNLEVMHIYVNDKIVNGTSNPTIY